MRKTFALALCALTGPVLAEGLFDPGEIRPEPAKPAPAVPDAPRPEPPAPKADPTGPVALPAGCKMSRPSAPGEARTPGGVRVAGAADSGVKEAWFTVERWASREKGWVPGTFSVKKGEAIGAKRKVGGLLLDFATPWILVDIKKEDRTVPGDPIEELKRDASGKPITDESGAYIKVTRPGPDKLKPVLVGVLQHARALEKDGSPLQRRVDLVKGTPVSLPDFSEDELPPLPPPPEE